MADRPILFSAPMVRALLDGRKTQTRRALMSQPYTVEGVVYTWEGPKSAFLCGPQAVATNLLEHGAARYAPGDRLWVRESWRAESVYDDTPPRDIEFDSCMVCYEADGSWSDHDAMTHAGRLRPGIHMPRWASRLTLTVTDVRVQRLQDISEADAVAEGVQPQRQAFTAWDTPVNSFRTLWNSINGPDAWDANPWVVALTFAVHRCNIDKMGDPA